LLGNRVKRNKLALRMSEGETATRGKNEKARHLLNGRLSLYVLVGRTRFELVTNGLKVRCSTN
jgi:hypothetical protein